MVSMKLLLSLLLAGGAAMATDAVTVAPDAGGFTLTNWPLPGVLFDAATMKAGTNVLKLTVPAGPVTAGVEYDYLRLEVEESK